MSFNPEEYPVVVDTPARRQFLWVNEDDEECDATHIEFPIAVWNSDRTQKMLFGWVWLNGHRRARRYPLTMVLRDYADYCAG